MNKHSLALFGFGSGIAANNPDCALGPWYLFYHPEILARFTAMNASWQTIIQSTSSKQGMAVWLEVERNLFELSEAVLPFAQQRKPFCVIGGDHSCGIATWSAVAHANRQQGDIGMIWIDAHMDSHTPDTSLTKNIHGMPFAHLLGYGIPSLCQIFDNEPKLKPENVCLIGIRSYEANEAEFLARLGVKIYFMAEVQQRGLEKVMLEACQQVTASTCGFGISIDLDAIDPWDAPGVGYRESGGLNGQALIHGLQTIPKQQLLALELAEYNPIRDEENGKTARLLVDIMQAVYS